MDSLFSQVDLDQELLALERKKEKQVVEEKKEEKSDERFDKKLFIIDGYSLIYRSYYAFITRPILDGNGTNISAYFGFFNTIFMLLKEYEFDYLAIAFDSSKLTFRHEMYPPYKQNREKAPQDLHSSVPLIQETLRKLNIKMVSQDGFEADDIIATLCKNATKLKVDAVMVTADKDLLQLVDDHVKALRPPKKGQPKYELFGKAEVKESYSVYPNQIIDYLAILGDSSDNVPGVKGIGEVSAVKLLEEYLTLDGIYRHLDLLQKKHKSKLEEQKVVAYLSKELVTLKSDIFSLESFDDDNFSTKSIKYENAIEDFLKYNCKALAKTASSLSGKGPALLKKEEKKIKESDNTSLLVSDELLGVGSYELLTDIKLVRSHFENASRSDGIVAFDTETTSLDIFYASLVGFSFSYEVKKAYYCPLICQGKEYLKIDDVINLFKSYFETGKLKLVGQNIKFDYSLLKQYGVEIKYLEADTMIQAWLYDSNKGIYNIDSLANHYLKYETIHFDDIVKKGENFSSVDLENACKYAAEDADLTLRLYKIFTPLIDNRVLKEYELPLIEVLSEMESNGILLDKTFMKDLNEKLSKRLAEVKAKIYQEAGYEFNVNSSMQLSKVLFEDKKLDAQKKTQKGFSTDTETLEALKGKDPIIEYLLEYRSLSKLLSTYVDTLPLLCDGNDRIHTSFSQTGTATGRLASRNPNLQNIPIRSEDGRMIRSAFIPKAGYIFLSADYSQIELVVLAHLSNDSELCKAFTSGIDVHKHTASLIFNKEIDEVTSDERRIAKTINFGIMYGMSPFRLSNELNISRSEAKEFINRYFDRYSGVKSFVENVIKSAEERGYVKTLGGHIRRILAINSVNKTEKAASERVAVNTLIQGSAAEIMKKAMTDIYAEFKSLGLKSKLLLQVHDELIFEVLLSEYDKVYEIVKTKMESAIELNVPLKASLESALRWGDMH